MVKMFVGAQDHSVSGGLMADVISTSCGTPGGICHNPINMIPAFTNIMLFMLILLCTDIPSFMCGYVLPFSCTLTFQATHFDI